MSLPSLETSSSGKKKKRLHLYSQGTEIIKIGIFLVVLGDVLPLIRVGFITSCIQLYIFDEITEQAHPHKDNKTLLLVLFWGKKSLPGATT